MPTTLLFALEIKFVLKIESSAWGISRILCYKTLKKRQKHSRSGKKQSTSFCVSPYTSLHCFTTKQSTVEAYLLVKQYIILDIQSYM